MSDLLTEAPTSEPCDPPSLGREPTKSATELDKLYSELGGAAAIGRIVGASTEHVAAMKRRGSIPIEHWPALIMSVAGKAVGLTEARLLFAHTGIATGSAATAPRKPVEDADARVRWTPEDPDLVLASQPATRVYANDYGQVVICQEAGPCDDEDPFLLFQPDNIPRLIEALRGVSGIG